MRPLNIALIRPASVFRSNVRAQTPRQKMSKKIEKKSTKISCALISKRLIRSYRYVAHSNRWRKLSVTPLYDLLACFVQKLEHTYRDTKHVRKNFGKIFNKNPVYSHFKMVDPILLLCGSFEPSKRELSIAPLYDLLA